jgi:hypothetical protein
VPAIMSESRGLLHPSIIIRQPFQCMLAYLSRNRISDRVTVLTMYSRSAVEKNSIPLFPSPT